MFYKMSQGGAVVASWRDRLKNNIAVVEDRLARACARAGRNRGELTLVAVTKTVAVNVAAALPELGLDHLAESRPQELWRKAELLPAEVRWQLIGHLQRNKVARVLPLVERIHSVDSVRLLQSLDQEAGRLGRSIPVFLEVNASGEERKQGFTPEEVPALVPVIKGLGQIQIKGLMTMAPLVEPQKCRATFARLRDLRDQLASYLAPPHDMTELSMGMSNDFEVAVEEGATFLRLGSVLFEGIPHDPD